MGGREEGGPLWRQSTPHPRHPHPHSHIHVHSPPARVHRETRIEDFTLIVEDAAGQSCEAMATNKDRDPLFYRVEGKGLRRFAQVGGRRVGERRRRA